MDTLLTEPKGPRSLARGVPHKRSSWLSVMSAGAVRAPLILPLRLPFCGKTKNQIDTGTQIDISSSTPGVQLYFTIDGSRPNPATYKPRRRGGPTYLFRNPFTLPAGARTVKAVAVLPSTMRESNVVTKTFDVAQSDVTESGENGASETRDDYGFLEELRSSEKNHFLKVHETGPLHSTERPVQNTHRTGLTSGLPPPILKHNFKGDEKLSVEETCNSPTSGSVLKEENEAKRRITFPDERRQFERTQRNVDLLHCPTCFASRPVDANAVFCRSCGGALPPLPTPIALPPRVDRLTVCTACGSTCSLDANACLVCEAPVGSTLLADRKPSEMERRLCPTCGSLNPVQMASCLTCEASLPQGMASLINISSLLPCHQVRPTSVMSMWSEPTPLSMNTRPAAASSECRVCHRQNSPDARFCDRCGTKDPCIVNYQQSMTPSVNFTACNTNLNSSATLKPPNAYLDPAMEANHLLHSQATMNSLLEPQRQSQPVPGADHLMCTKCFSVNTVDSRFCVRCGTAFGPPLPSKTSMFALSSVPNTLSGPPEPRKRTLSSIGTQTTGLYYPSAGDLRRALSDVQLLNNLKKDIRTRARLLAPISPGRGYWRMQLEHILVHLKAHTQNNADFRNLLGNPRLGKLLYAGIEEDEGELTIFMTFQHHNPRITTQDLLPMPSEAQSDRINRDGGVPRAAARSQAHQRNNNNCSSPLADNAHFEDDSWASNSFDNLTITDDLSEDGATGPLRPKSSARGGRGSSKMGGKGSRRVQQKRGGRNKAKSHPVPEERKKGNGNFAGTNSSENSGSNDTYQRPQPLHSRCRADPNASLIPGLAAVVEQRIANLSPVDSALLQHLRSGPNGRDKEVTDLLAKGANPRCIDPSGDAALIVAVRNRHLGAIPSLVQAGADVNTVGNRNGNSVLHEAVLLGDEAMQIVKTLLELGADPTGKNAQGRSAQDIADESGFVKLSNLLAAEVGRKKRQEGTDGTVIAPAYEFEHPAKC
ncbi:hypothetical protein SprV_0401629500 [Sparganum proliferum]